MIPGFDWIWAGLSRGQHAAGGVARHEPRQQEVQRHRDPQREHVEAAYDG